MNTSVVTCVYRHAVREVQPGSALDTLLSDEFQSAPFDRLWWWQALDRHCDLPGTLYGARSQQGEAVLALHPKGPRHLHSLSNWYTFRFRPIVEGNPALLVDLARSLRKHARRITLDTVPDEDGSASRLVDTFRKAGWLVLRETCDTNHVLKLDGRGYAAYHASLPGPLRTTLKRKSAKVATTIHTRFEPETWARYEAIYARSWKPGEGSPAFLQAFAQAEGDAGRLRLGLAHDAARPDAPPIAAQLWTVEGGTAYIHKLAHLETARNLSPGSVLSAALFRHAIDTDGVDLVDFGTGDDPYKRDWMNEVRPRYRIEAFMPFAPANAPILLRRTLQRLAARIKRR